MTKQKRHKPEEIILLLRECDASDLSQESFCQQKQISVATLHRWRKKYGMMDVADAKGSLLRDRLITPAGSSLRPRLRNPFRIDTA